MIQGFNQDIKKWLKDNLESEISELKEKEAKGRKGTKSSINRQKSIVAKTERSELLEQIKRFIYSPDSNNLEREALNHAEVIKITSAFLTKRLMMQKLLVNRFPFLLIDESQDTDKGLMQALLHVQTQHKESFVLGLLGDTMQQIYMGGKLNLGTDLPNDWAKPAKKINHRSSRRIIELINRIRRPVDNQQQQACSDKDEGFVRLFILPADSNNKPERERNIYKWMAEATADEGWLEPNTNVKTLLLEHHMSAKRLDFLPLWETCSQSKHLQNGLRDGTLPGLRFFSHLIFPLIEAHRNKDRFGIASIIRKNSPLLDRKAFKVSGSQINQIERSKKAVSILTNLWEVESSPTFLQVLQKVAETKLFELPEVLRPFVASRPTDELENKTSYEEESKEQENDELITWQNFLETPFDQIQHYRSYIEGRTEYDTHQGVKGLEFPRVSVIMDDSEARGFTFSYEKLFGVKQDSKKREPEKESSIDRTRRLFYVTCSRAEDSLALIAYTTNPQKVQDHVIKEGWFKEEEIELIS